MNHHGVYPENWEEIALGVKSAAGWKCIRCARSHNPVLGYCLTVHHFDGNKANCEWWNLLALCQRCHLSIQGRVDPHVPYFLEHSDWLKVYVAGFYANKYQQRILSREQVLAELETLLSLERVA